MGQRTQIGVNVIFVGTDGTERVRREIYHYQWGGYSNIMFENLIGFFINVRHYIYNLKNQKYSFSNISIDFFKSFMFSSVLFLSKTLFSQQ